MNLNKLRQILRLSDSPAWATRNPDQQVAPAPETPMPLKQGGIPNVPGAPQPQKPGKMNPQAMKQAADSLLLGNDSNQGGAPSGIPGTDMSSNSSLTNALRMRRNARKSSETLPGSIGYSRGGNY